MTVMAEKRQKQEPHERADSAIDEQKSDSEATVADAPRRRAPQPGMTSWPSR